MEGKLSKIKAALAKSNNVSPVKRFYQMVVSGIINEEGQVTILAGGEAVPAPSISIPRFFYGDQYDDWFLELQRLAVYKYNFCLYAALTLDKNAYKEYYNNNYSPEDAMIEDLSYGDVEVC